MKIVIYLILLLINLLIVQSSCSCPNCVAKVTESTLPFFADDFYNPSETDSDDIQNEAEQ